MDFETIDWPLEAQRVAAAFDQPEAMQMVDDGSPKEIEIRFEDHVITVEFFTFLEYPGYYVFTVYDLIIPNPQWVYFSDPAYIKIDEYSQMTGERAIPLYWPTLGKALLLLGHLSPELQTELKCPFTAHEKLEWRLEFEARMEAAK